MINRTTQYKKLINCQKWAKLRSEKLKNNPLCEHCQVAGIITPGAEIHHITPIDTGANYERMKLLAYNYNNLVTLCHTCHIQAHVELQSKTAKQTQARNTAKVAGFVSQFLSEKK
ncbi:MAG: HNH endonuclease [Paludibacteraceae bacterium]